MLVLSRKVGEAIELTDLRTGEIIRIEQVRIGPTVSRIGITASQHYAIRRTEVSAPTEITEQLAALADRQPELTAVS